MSIEIMFIQVLKMYRFIKEEVRFITDHVSGIDMLLILIKHIRMKNGWMMKINPMHGQ
jgi:hypothetical protein